jgi:hypothetical protein
LHLYTDARDAQALAAGARLTDPVGVNRCTHFSRCVWAHTVALWASE